MKQIQGMLDFLYYNFKSNTILLVIHHIQNITWFNANNNIELLTPKLCSCLKLLH